MSSKKVEQVYIGAYIYNGGFRAFQNYPVQITAWTINYRDSSEFLDQPVTRALTGFSRGNPFRWRQTIDVNLDSSREGSTLRTLFNLCASQYDRTFLTTAFTGATSTSVTLTSGVATNDFYNGLVFNDGTSEWLITDYVGSTKVATISGTGTPSGSSGFVVAKPNYPTIIGLSVDNSNGTMVYCNLLNGVYGLQRELTIGTQIIQLNLEEVVGKQLVDNNLTLS